jgi:hypothetical protein
LLLAIITLTSSVDCFHNMAAMTLMMLLFYFYASRLLQVQSPWIVVHCLIPSALVFGCCSFGNYGIWQKGLIVYYVVCTVIDAELSVPDGSTK